LLFDLRQNGEVVGVDQGVPGILEGGPQILRPVEPEVNLVGGSNSGPAGTQLTSLPLRIRA